MSGPRVLLDACTLVPMRLTAALLWMAEAELLQPLWSEEILQEVQRNLPRVGLSPDAAERRVSAMRDGFGAESMIAGYEELIPSMDCDPKDRHVLAAATAAHADVLVTSNLKDFPSGVAEGSGIEIVDPDQFMITLWANNPTTVMEALEWGISTLKNPPLSVREFLTDLSATVPTFANLAADATGIEVEERNPVPPLVQVSEEDALAAYGTPGDRTNPAQVGLLWWFCLDEHQSQADSLMMKPAGRQGLAHYAKLVENRSLASGVKNLLGTEDFVFMRFVPEAASSSQAMSSYRESMVFLVLCRTPDKTWKVWRLGRRLPTAHQLQSQRP